MSISYSLGFIFSGFVYNHYNIVIIIICKLDCTNIKYNTGLAHGLKSSTLGTGAWCWQSDPPHKNHGPILDLPQAFLFFSSFPIPWVQHLADFHFGILIPGLPRASVTSSQTGCWILGLVVPPSSVWISLCFPACFCLTCFFCKSLNFTLSTVLSPASARFLLFILLYKGVKDGLCGLHELLFISPLRISGRKGFILWLCFIISHF